MDFSVFLNRFLVGSMELGIKLLYCAAVIIICTLLIRLSRKSIHRFFTSNRDSVRFMDSRKANTLDSMVSSVVKYIFYALAFFIILSKLGVSEASIVAVMGAGSVAVALGAQNLVQDIIAGFFILFEDQYGVGDIVTIEGHTGTVEGISLRTTHLRAADGTVFIIPNGSVKIVTNMCKEFINAVVDIDIDYSENMDRVLKVLNDEMEKAFIEIKGLRQKPTVLGIISLGENAVTVRITAECEIKENYRIERELKLTIKKRLDTENISIPFPQRTVHIKKD